MRLILLFVACAATEAERAPDPPLALQGTLRFREEGCANQCDRYQMTWAEDGEVSLTYHSDSGASLTVTDASGRRHTGGMPATEYPLRFAARAGVAYTVEVLSGYSDGIQYRLEAVPAPERRQLVAHREPPPRPDAEELVTDDQIKEAVDKATAGAKPLGGTIRGHFGKLQSFPISVPRGKCVWPVMVLDRDARLKEEGKDFPLELDFTVVSNGDSSGASVREGENVRVLTMSEGICPSASGRGEIRYSRNYKRVYTGGKGGFTLRYYARSISGGELRDRDARENRDFCADCLRQKYACQHSQYPLHCSRDFQECAAGLSGCR